MYNYYVCFVSVTESDSYIAEQHSHLREVQMCCLFELLQCQPIQFSFRGSETKSVHQVLRGFWKNLHCPRRRLSLYNFRDKSMFSLSPFKLALLTILLNFRNPFLLMWVAFVPDRIVLFFKNSYSTSLTFTLLFSPCIRVTDRAG